MKQIKKRGLQNVHWTYTLKKHLFVCLYWAGNYSRPTTLHPYFHLYYFLAVDTKRTVLLASRPSGVQVKMSEDLVPEYRLLLGFYVFCPLIYFLVKFHLLVAKVITVAVKCNHTDKEQVGT